MLTFAVINKKYCKMETTSAAITTKRRNRRTKKLSPEEKRAINATIVPQNRSMKAFLEHRGETWVKDPMLLL